MDDKVYRQESIDNVIKHLQLDCDNSWLVKKAINSMLSEKSEIVRCKYCKHLFDGTYRANCCEVLMEKAKWIQEITVDEYWFCASGERKEDGEV